MRTKRRRANVDTEFTSSKTNISNSLAQSDTVINDVSSTTTTTSLSNRPTDASLNSLNSYQPNEYLPAVPMTSASCINLVNN